MEKDKINTQEDALKRILANSTLKGSDNLKYRIMHQIEVEKTVFKERKTDTYPFVANMFSIFGIMYLFIAIIGGIVYFSGGKEALLSIAFFIPAVLIASVCSVFWMISIYDDKRVNTQRSRK